MKKLAIILLLFRSCSPTYAQAGKNIYTPLYPLSVQYVNKTGSDSNFIFFISQSYLDSLKNIYSFFNILSTTVTNLSNLEKNDVAGIRLQITGISNQVATDGVNIAMNTAGIASNKKTTDSIVSNWPSGGGGTKPLPRTITSSTYQIIQSDNNVTLLFPSKCTISIATNIQMPFECSIIQEGAINTQQVVFTGINVSSGNSWKRIKFQYGRVFIVAVASGLVNLNGDLKL